MREQIDHLLAGVWPVKQVCLTNQHSEKESSKNLQMSPTERVKSASYLFSASMSFCFTSGLVHCAIATRNCSSIVESGGSVLRARLVAA